MDAALDGVVGKAEKGAQPQQQGKSAKQVLGEPHPGGGLWSRDTILKSNAVKYPKSEILNAK